MALKEAYDSGAAAWSNARKSQFANDPLNQWCLLAGLNISKSDGDLAEWRGGSCAQRKHIAQITVRVKGRYGLSTDSAEQRAISAALAATCAGAATAPTATGVSQTGAGAAGSPRAGAADTQAGRGNADSLAAAEVSGGRIVARRLPDGQTEFGWLPTGSTAYVLPAQRYFPTNARVDRWLKSSPVEVGGVEIGRINARLRANGRIEFAFAPTGGQRILPPSRYFPAGAAINVWLRSTEIDLE